MAGSSRLLTEGSQQTELDSTLELAAASKEMEETSRSAAVRSTQQVSWRVRASAADTVAMAELLQSAEVQSTLLVRMEGQALAAVSREMVEPSGLVAA